MKIKKIISLCKANKYILLYDMTTQMLSDGFAAYYLNDCPVFSIDSLMTSFDITPTQADKIVQRYTAEPTEAFLKMVKDEFDGEERCDPLPISLRIGSYDYIPYKTSAGIELVESKYLEPLDVDEFELYYRQTESGAFFAAKAGFFVMAIIPISTARVLTENTVGYLDELSSMSSIKYENLK